jgi:succinate dehydrogenase / fumarate reductase membrane anchor subunit
MKQELRTPFASATGLGSAKEGVEHWWAQRVTAVALILLGLWFVGSLIALAGADHLRVIAWLHGPLAALLTMLMLVAMFYHTALGLQVVIEDYVHSEGVKIAAIVALRLLCWALAAAGIFAVLRIVFGR